MRAQDAVLAPDDFAEDVLCEMANLDSSDTGVDGIIFISTRIGSHGPRVKWFAGAPQGRRDPCLIVSIAPEPEIRDNFLGRAGERIAPEVVAWVRLNHAALQRFWDDGHSWTWREVSDFIDSLRRA